MPEDDKLLLDGDDQSFALKQCLKMAYYVSKVRGYEILMMKAEFFKDENGFIWFFYAHDIFVRKNLNRQMMSSEDAKKEARKIQQNKEKLRMQMISELQAYESQQKATKNNSTNKMMAIMNNYYTQMKSEVGIDKNQSIQDVDDGGMDEILRTLKPNTTARNFKEFLGVADNCNRTQAWRAISRKMYARDKKDTEVFDQNLDP